MKVSFSCSLIGQCRQLHLVFASIKSCPGIRNPRGEHPSGNSNCLSTRTEHARSATAPTGPPGRGADAAQPSNPPNRGASGLSARAAKSGRSISGMPTSARHKPKTSAESRPSEITTSRVSPAPSGHPASRRGGWKTCCAPWMRSGSIGQFGRRDQPLYAQQPRAEHGAETVQETGECRRPDRLGCREDLARTDPPCADMRLARAGMGKSSGPARKCRAPN